MLGCVSRVLAGAAVARSCQVAARRGVAVSRLHTHEMEIGDGRSVAYKTLPGMKSPSIVMVPGLHSYTHMSGQKASCLLRYCDMNDYPCVVYDHECSGQSQKSDVRNVLFSHWVEDALAVVDRLTEGPVVLVGSSLGGWLSLIAAQQIPERLHGLVLFSPALNYVWPYYNRHKETLPPAVAARLEAGDIHVHTHEFGDALLKKDFAENSRQYELDLEQNLSISCPVRIIHGLKDTEVKAEGLIQLTKALDSTDVDLIYRKDSDHQLISTPDMELFLVALDRMLKDNPVR